MARRRRRSRGDSHAGGRVPAWLTIRRVAAVVMAVAVVIALIYSGAFTRFFAPRDTGTDVVDDSSAIVGLSSTHSGVGTKRHLTTLTNNLSQSATFEVKLTGESTEWGSLFVDGIDKGDSVGFTDLGSGASKQIDVSLVCDESLVGKNITYEVSVSGTDLSGTIENRTVPMKQYCLTWYDAADWDANASEHGVVHEDIGDRNASDIELGYNATADGLVAYWPFDEESGSTATDVAGSNDGTINNDAVLGETGILNSSSYEFKGDDEYVQVPDSSSLEMNNTNAVTVSMWVKKDTAQSGWVALLQHSDQSYNLQMDNGNEPEFTIYDTTWESATTGISLNNNEWYHIAGTFDGSTIRLYINGTERGTGSADFIDDGGGFDIGIAENLDATGRHFDGPLDEVRVYDRALSQSEINRLANGSNPANSSAAFNGTLTTDWESAETLSARDLNLTDTVANVSDGTVNVTVESDTNDDGTADETSDPITLNGSTGPYAVSGMSTDTDKFRLKVDLSTTTITDSPCFSGATLGEKYGLGKETRDGCGMTNVTANAPPTASFTTSSADWYNDSWNHRKKITINHTQVDANLTNFPVLINRTDTDLAEGAQADGDDILFTKSNSETKLAHEIEKFNGSTGDLVAWVKVPSIDASSNTTLYVYYNNSAAANQENLSGVWSNGYRAVWHLPEDPSGSAPQMADSTSNNNNGTTQGSMTSGDQVTAKVDGGLDLDGSDDYIEICRGDCDTSLNITGTEFTLEAWAKPPGGGVSDDFGLIDKHDDGNDERYMFGIEDSGGSPDLLTCRATEQDSDGGGDEDDQGRIDASGVERGAWNYLGCRYNGSQYGTTDTLEGFVNASVVGGTDTTDDGEALDNNIKSAVDDIILGKRYNSRYYPGIYYELRISAVTRSDAYLSTTYNNTNDPSSFVIVGSEENGTLAHFDGSGSSDDGSISTYEWDFTDDGTYEESSGSETTFHRYSSTGTYDVKLRVTDNENATDTTMNSVTLDGGVYWSRRVAITLDHTQVESDLTDFPVLVSIKDTDLAWKAQDDGDDLVFTKSDGETKLAHEIEEFNGSSGDLTAWVNVTSLSSTSDTTIYLYYGNSSAPNQEDPAGVWDSNYKMIQHLNETSGDAIDSTTYDNDGTILDVAARGQDGKIGGVYDFEASNNHGVEVPNDDSLNITDKVTLSAWVKPETVGNWKRIVAKSHTTNDYPYTLYGLLFDDADHFRTEIASCTSTGDSSCQNDVNGGTTVPSGAWTHATITYDGSTMRVYFNGSQDGSESLSTTIPTNDVNLTLGKSEFEDDYYDGLMDEVRVSDTDRSAAWIETTYNNTNTPSNFHISGSEEHTAKRSFS